MKRIVVVMAVSLAAVGQQIDWSQISNKPSVSSRDYRFTRTNGSGASGDLSASGANTVTLTPCPKGVAGADSNHPVYISGGTGTAEVVTITGGTCTSGAATGTLTFTTSNTHSGAWTVTSASSGIDEAIRSLPAEGGIVTVPYGISQIYSTLVIYKKYVKVVGVGQGSYDAAVSSGSELKWMSSSAGTVMSIVGPNEDVHVEQVRINMNSVATVGFLFNGCERCSFMNNAIVNPATGSNLLQFEAISGPTGNNAFIQVGGNFLRGDVNGVSCIVMGETPPAPAYDSGTWNNDVFRNFCKYQSDVATSNGIELRWADNNLIRHNLFQAQTLGHAVSNGAAVYLAKQALLDTLPSENKFIGNQLGGNANTVACRGESGIGGTHFLNYQLVESGAEWDACTGNIWLQTTAGQIVSKESTYGWRFSGKVQVANGAVDGHGLLLYHDGSDSYIRARDPDVAGEELRLGHQSHGDMIVLDKDGAVTLKNNSYAAALKTTTDGYVTIGADNYLYITPVAFSVLNGVAPSNGTMKPCSDCQVTSGADNTCASGGTGALAVRLNGVWRCFATQN